MPPARKKTTSETTPKKPAAAAAPARKSAKGPAPAGGSLIDMSLGAAAAARMIAARAAGKLPEPAGAGTKETALFKQMKENIAKPHAAAVDSFLNDTASPGSRPSDLPSAGPKQVGHNQTFNADVARRNLPRRTGG